MRNFLLVIFCLAILPMAGYCQAAYLSPQWFDDMGAGTGSATSTAMKVDAAENTYVTGSFTGTVDFDPSASVKNLTTPAGTTSGFIAKYKADGTLVWVYPLSGTGVVSPNGINLGGDGSISIAGKYTATMDADPGPGIQTLSATGGNDAFIIHLNSSGAFLWARSVGGSAQDAGNKVSGDASGNLYVAMQFQGTVTVGGTSYTAKGTTDGLLVKYDQAGNVVLVIDLGYTGSAFDTTVSDVAVDKNNNIDIIGYINGIVDFNPLGVAHPVSASNSMYIAQYTSAGTYSWMTSIQGGFQTNNSISLAVDGVNNIYVSSYFSNTATFGPGNTLTAIGTHDLLLVKYGLDGSLAWHKDIGSGGTAVTPTGLVISADNNTLYVSGYFTGVVDFDPGAGKAVLSYHGQRDIFMAEYATQLGSFDNAINMGNASCNNMQAAGLGLMSTGDVLLTGAFCSTTPFSGNLSCDGYQETAKSPTQDMFLVRYTLTLAIANNSITNPQNCTGVGPVVLTGTVPTGGVGLYTYDWQSSTDSLHYTSIGVTTKDYAPPVTGSTVYYLRKVFSGDCEEPSLSNVLAVSTAQLGVVTNNIIDTTGLKSGCGGAGATSLKASLPTGGGGTYTYQWQMSFNNLTWSDVGETIITFPTSQNLGAISYNVTFYVRRLVMIPGCSTPSISPVVKFTALPRLDNITIHATGSTDFCGSGNPGTLTGDSQPTGGDGPGTYTYQWKSTTTNLFEDIPGATKADYVPGVLTKTTYFKREVLSGPCYTGDPGLNSNPIIVTVKPLITVTSNTIAQNIPDGTLCRATADPSLITGQAVSGGSGVFAYQWQQSTDNINYVSITGATDKDYDPPKIAQTTYYRRVVTYSDANSCSTPNLSNIVVVKVATANVSNNTIAQPVPDATLICSVPADPKPITGSTATGSGFTYQWQSSLDSIHFTDIAGVTTKDYDPPQITRSTYYRRAAVIPDTCVTPDYSNIISIKVSDLASANIIVAPKDTLFCDAGDATNIYGVDVTGIGVQYQWQSSPDNITYTDITNATNASFDPLLSTSTIYYRRSVSTAVCDVPSVSPPVKIAVYKTPVAAVSDSVIICVGNKTTLTASGGAQYKWTPSAGLSADNVAAPIASPDTTTLYTVTVSNGGCNTSASVKVTVIPKPKVDAGPDQKMFKGDVTQLNGKVTGTGVQYSWSPATYLDNPNILNPKAAPTESITYTLTAIADHGCSIITDDVRLNVFEKVVIPTAFTPNNDGKNDTWEISGLSTYPNSILTVFTRDGAEVFRTVSYSKAWDGTFNGKPLPFGTYYYVLDLKSGFNLMSGWVALVK